LSVLAFSFLKMEAQTSFAVVYQDSLEAFVGEVFFQKNMDNLFLKEFRDSIGQKEIKLFEKNLIKYYRNSQSSISQSELNIQEAYLKYLEKELISMQEKSNTFLQNIEKSADLVLQNHIQHFYKKIAAERNLSLILNADELAFYDENAADLTPLLLKNLNQNKTILSEQMYFKDFTMPLILKIHQEFELVDYATFKKDYENPKGAW